MVGALGLFNFGMTMGADGHMSGCPFMGTTAVCQMTPLEHISAWQNMFTATVTQNSDQFIILMSLFGLTFIAIAALRLMFDSCVALLESRQKLYAKRLPAFSLTNPLQEAFSQGILNPKLY